MTSPTDLARAETEKLLPCEHFEDCGWDDKLKVRVHSFKCPAFHRAPVAQALAALMVERDAEWNKALAECRLIVRRHQRDFPEHLRGELEDAIVALRRPDAPAKTEMPGEDDGWTGKMCPHCDGVGEHADGSWCNKCGGTGNEYVSATPTIEELRAKVVEEVTALCIVADTYGVRSESMAEAVYRLYDCNRTLQSKERDLG